MELKLWSWLKSHFTHEKEEKELSVVFPHPSPKRVFTNGSNSRINPMWTIDIEHRKTTWIPTGAHINDQSPSPTPTDSFYEDCLLVQLKIYKLPCNPWGLWGSDFMAPHLHARTLPSWSLHPSSHRLLGIGVMIWPPRPPCSNSTFEEGIGSSELSLYCPWRRIWQLNSKTRMPITRGRKHRRDRIFPTSSHVTSDVHCVRALGLYISLQLPSQRPLWTERSSPALRCKPCDWYSLPQS